MHVFLVSGLKWKRTAHTHIRKHTQHAIIIIHSFAIGCNIKTQLFTLSSSSVQTYPFLWTQNAHPGLNSEPYLKTKTGDSSFKEHPLTTFQIDSVCPVVTNTIRNIQFYTYAACSPCDEKFVMRTRCTQDLPIVQALKDGDGL